MKRWIGVGLLLALCSTLPAAQTQTPATCPPQAQAPTPQQVQAAATNARDRGLLWRLSRDGRTAYLYGSIHVGKLDWAFPGPRLRAALAASDTVALEIDVGDPQMAARMQPPAGLTPPTLDAALRKRLAHQVDAACLPKALLASQHPVMQAVTLTVLAARWQGLDAGYAQEFMLSGLARGAQQRVVSFESPESQMAALIPREPAATERLVEQMLDQLEQGSAQRVLARLAAAWERGDLAELADYAGWCDCAVSDDDRALMRRLNDERNPALADAIEAQHRQGRKLFAAVGSLHMTGPKALPALLAQRGFTVERVALR